MKTVLLRMFIAVVLAAFAWLSWSESRLAARVADAKQDLATFNHESLDGLTPARSFSDYLPGDRRQLSDELRIAKARVAYWLGRYGAVAADTDSGQVDADILLTAANAAFRDAQRDPATGPAAAQRLDGVLQVYASALKARASAKAAADAAYNYEFVARIRDQVARSQGKTAKIGPITPVTPRRGGDLPLGATIHGAPGAPPPDAKMEELQMIAPMEYGDREAQPEATPGARCERKG
ncbi:MAG: hypothetical protein ABI024_00655 [Vicinamibacterales bacterium]